MKTKRFDFDFKPLLISRSLTVEQSVPNRQTYNADSGDYTPDYTLTPLTIQPRVGVMDKDGILPSGDINDQLANVRWYEIIAGARTLIDDSNDKYVITRTGGNTGRIVVKKNAMPSVPITLEFFAEYVDSRTSQIYTIRDTMLILCKSEANIPVLYLDAADQTIYDPLVSEDMQTVHAFMKIGTTECNPENAAFVWELLREDNTWSQVGEDEVLDYCASVSDNGTSCTINRALMGESLTLRCRGAYDAGGNDIGQGSGNELPFKYASDVNSITDWYYLELNIAGSSASSPNFRYIYAPTTYGFLLNRATVEEQNKDDYAWGFVGNPVDGFKLYHAKSQQYLSMGESVPVLDVDGQVWTLSPSSDSRIPGGFTISAGGKRLGFYYNKSNSKNVLGYNFEYNDSRSIFVVELAMHTPIISDSSSSKIIRFERRIHKFDFDIMNCPTNIPSGLVAISPTASVYDTKGEIQDSEKELLVLWYVAANESVVDLDYTQIAHGKIPGMLSTSKMNLQFGAVYGIDVIDIGPVAAWEDGDGKLLEDGDGNIILIH